MIHMNPTDLIFFFLLVWCLRNFFEEMHDQA